MKKRNEWQNHFNVCVLSFCFESYATAANAVNKKIYTAVKNYLINILKSKFWTIDHIKTHETGLRGEVHLFLN